MTQTLGAITLVVREYDEAIAFFVGTLGFELLEDTPLEPPKRWVRVRPAGSGSSQGTSILLARAATPTQATRIGDQTGGRVFLFLETDDLRQDYARWRARGVRFLETPRDEPYGTVVVFEDLYGNRWDLIERRRGAVGFDPQPVLRGDLLELRPLRADDFEALFQVASDPLIWEQHPDRDRYQEATFRAFFADALASGGALVAVDRASGLIVGSSRFHGFDADRSVVEIGWSFLARACWGGRYNGELKRLMLEHAFRTVERVVFIIGPDNRRSQRAVEKIGAAPAGTTLDPQGRERLVYELTPARYARRP